MLKKLTLLIFFCASVMMLNAKTENGVKMVQVDSTQLASLNNVRDVISQVAGVNYHDDAIYVDGRGAAEVYLGERKLNELTELLSTPANKVKNIQIIKTPGAQYGKTVRAVVIINLKPVTDEGLTLNENLSFSYTDRLATSNQLNLGWKRNRINAGAYVGWEQVRSLGVTDIYAMSYDNKVPTAASKEANPTYIHNQQLMLKGNLGYDLAPGHHLEGSYTFIRKPRTSAVISEIEHFDYQTVGGKIDFDHPVSSSMNPGMRVDVPASRHMVDVEYSGHINQWTLSAGTNITYEKKDSCTSFDVGTPYDYLFKETITRSYIKANLPVGEGAFDMGVEYNTDRANAMYNIDNPDPSIVKLNRVHTDNIDKTLAAYVSLSQSFGIWTLSGGMRYEGNFLTYRPYGDDGMMTFLDEVMPIIIDKVDPAERLFAQLWMNRKYKRENHHIYPSLTMSAKLGKSTLSLSHLTSYVKAYLPLSLITLRDLNDDALLAKILDDEYITSTVLGWKWEWLNVSLAYNRHQTPLFSTITTFNTEDYDDIDLGVSVAPTIGPWSPSLSMNLHKQWLDIDCGEPDKLSVPMLTMSWTNSLSLPDDWCIYLNADWHSRGSNADLYFRSTNLSMDASVQKQFPRQHLTVQLQMSNIFRRSYNDITVFGNDASSLIAITGRNPRTLTLSLNYHF